MKRNPHSAPLSLKTLSCPSSNGQPWHLESLLADGGYGLSLRGPDKGKQGLPAGATSNRHGTSPLGRTRRASLQNRLRVHGEIRGVSSHWDHPAGGCSPGNKANDSSSWREDPRIASGIARRPLGACMAERPLVVAPCGNHKRLIRCLMQQVQEPRTEHPPAFSHNAASISAGS